LKLFPFGVIAPEFPLTFSVTFDTPSASLPNPVRIQSVVPLQGTNPAPFTWFQVVCCVLAKAAVGKIAQAAIKTVAAETVISPATVSRRLCLFLRSAGMSFLPSSVAQTREVRPSDGDRMVPTRATPSGEGLGLAHRPFALGASDEECT